MKSLLIAVGLAIALSVGAQTTTTDEQQQQPTGGQQAKTKTEENVQPAETKPGVQAPERARAEVRPVPCSAMSSYHRGFRGSRKHRKVAPAGDLHVGHSV